MRRPRFHREPICNEQQMAVKRTSHLGEGAVEGRGDVDSLKAGVVAARILSSS